MVDVVATSSKIFSIFFLLGLHTLFTGTDCKRVYYSFEVEHVPSNPDGYPIPVIRVSNTNTSFAGRPKRAFPGPIIRAQKGDTVVLKIHNKLHSEVTSIHFHGLHQYGNPWMDGVAGVTQPDIPPMSSFTYRFKVTQTGTFWYHSHSGHQIASGLLGPIILDYPDDELDPIKESYPYQPESESIIILQDWHHERGDDLFTNYRGPYNAFKSKSFQPNYPWSASSILMNGRGQFDCSKIGHNECVQFYGSPCSGKTQCIYAREPFLGPCRSSAHPLDEYNCSGNFARLRFINGAANAPLKLWIDKHNMTLVARDGVETIPLNVQFLLIAIGQRLDVMVECTAAPFKYHIFSEVAASFLPEGANNPLITIYASALLSYPNAAGIAKPDFWPPSKVNSDPGSNENELFEYQYKPLIRKTTPPAVRRIVLQYSDTYSSKAGEPLEEWIMNNVTHVMPARPLVQAAYMGLFPNSTVVVHAPGPEGNKRMTNILQLEYGQTYEFVVVGMNGQQHPWHLHGYWLDFVAAGTLNRQEDFVVDGVDECNYPRNVAIKKEVLDSLGPKTGEEATLLSVGDSFTVPRFGYSIFRVTMDNQGPWLFHCHVDWHMGMGMAMIISVEKDGLYPDIVEPPMDFPAYLPLSGFKKASSNSGLGQQM